MAFYRMFVLITLVAGSVSCSQKHETVEREGGGIQNLLGIQWIAYNPPWEHDQDSNSGAGVHISASDALRDDLSALRSAGFSGLVTYSCLGDWPTELPGVAQALGFKGIILGVWDPSSTNEIAVATRLAKSEIVLGTCVGNEGLGKRYSMTILKTALDLLRKATGKPATTTEEIDDYSDSELLSLGDWVFPNAHPYFHGQLDPARAVKWTEAAFADMSARSALPVIFKEVGLPTAGDKGVQLSEQSQRDYYLNLRQTKTSFVYFEAFDQPWKRHLPIEPHWGLFKSDRSPKLYASTLLSSNVQSVTTPRPFYVYRDVGSVENHFAPTGFMGDIGDVAIDDTCTNNPHSGRTCICIHYLAQGKGPSTADYPGPARWAGVYWQQPPNNWGKDAHAKGLGYKLSSYSKLVFCARADKSCTIEFKVGGIAETFGDSLIFPRAIRVELNPEWARYEIPLARADLSHVVGGFCWVTNQEDNPTGTVFYLDDIRYEE